MQVVATDSLHWREYRTGKVNTEVISCHGNLEIREIDKKANEHVVPVAKFFSHWKGEWSKDLWWGRALKAKKEKKSIKKKSYSFWNPCLSGLGRQWGGDLHNIGLWMGIKCELIGHFVEIPIKVTILLKKYSL